uniref:PH domain-containing protein n=1 Tax=Eptatretus burgeri TaxID=7764 RepID=A0A8C4R103_EPTBU
MMVFLFRLNARGETTHSTECCSSLRSVYWFVFLCSRKVEQAFEAGGWSSHELRQAFFRCVERGLQNCETISMREVMQKTWMSKFEVLLQGVAEESSPHQPSLGKDQLLEMFQKVLGIPKLEHQRIYNACQLDNADEQVAQIRRELGRRRERAAFAAKMKTFLDSNMEKTYVEEVKTSIQQLIDNLESLPLGKGGPRNRLVQHPVVSGDIASGGRTLAKYNINISFSFEVVVMEATGLVSVPSGKQVYCTMEMEGGDKLQTEAVDADKPKWHTQGDFTTAAPLPVLKVRLLTIVNKMLSLEDKELGKVTLRPSPMTMKPPEFHDLITPRHSSDENLQLLLHLRMERPPNLKHSGYLLARGKNVWRSWKKRFYALIQGSACTYILCNFQENKVEPQSIIQLDGYTVDYAQLPSDVYGGQVHFSLVREGETFHFGCDDAQDAGLWVQALYRATGQTHRPTLHGQGSSRHRRTSNVGACSDLGTQLFLFDDHLLIDKVLAADPCDLDHESLFELLQRLTFRYRMKDPYCSLGWFSPGQLFMLDEYCSRYGVSGCHRHLCYLDQLINRAEDGIAIDPTLLHYSYAFCTSHITQNKPDGFSSITVAENAHYKEIKDRLKLMLEHQISHFRFYFPFGLPEGALKATVGLLERVLMEDMSTPVPAEQIHSLLSTCLRRAAMINYMGLSAENGVWGESNLMFLDMGLEELHALAEECVDMLLQSEEQHGMASGWELFKEYSESFWSLFAVDMDALLNHQPDYSWGIFFSVSPSQPSNKSATSLELLGKLQMLQSFITDLQWPNEKYAASIDSRLKNNANDVMHMCVCRMGTAFEAKLKKMSKGLQMRVDETLCSMYNLLGDAKQHLGVFCCSDKQKVCACLGVRFNSSPVRFIHGCHQHNVVANGSRDGHEANIFRRKMYEWFHMIICCNPAYRVHIHRFAFFQKITIN